jgi:serine/threonine protein kinase
MGKRLIAKVADFGLSRKLLLSPELQERVVDNPTWLAPEILSCRPYTEKVDVYSFAIILWEMLVRVKPYAELEFMWEIQEMVLRGEVSECKMHILPLPLPLLLLSSLSLSLSIQDFYYFLIFLPFLCFLDSFVYSDLL